MKPLPFHPRAGFTLTELLIASTVAILLTGMLVIGSIMIQRNFIASDRYARNVAYQMLLLDSLSLDMRRALTVTSSSDSVRITMPDYYGEDGNPRTPTISGGKATYGSSPRVVEYRKTGNQVTRTEGGAVRTIASDVEDFQFNFRNEGQVVEISVSFLPTFRSNNQESSREGTTFFARTLLRNKI